MRNTSRIVTKYIKSSYVRELLPYQVLLPVSYYTNIIEHYPVLYLLHGLTGHCFDWLANTDLVNYSDAYSLVIIMVEGNNSWYSNSPIDPSQQYEDYVIQELIPTIDSQFRTINAGANRAIAGLSMGGYGAIKFALKYPSLFILAGSFSGAFRAVRWRDKDLKNWPIALESTKLAFGGYDSQTRKTNDVYQLIKELNTGTPYLYLSCGKSDVMLAGNKELVDLLSYKNISYQYQEVEGGHDWGFWDKQIENLLKLLNSFLNSNTK